MTLRDELASMHELATTGEWDIACLEDRDSLFDVPIGPEKACFIGSVCAHDALDDLVDFGYVTDSSAATTAESFAELDGDFKFDDLMLKIPSVGLKRLIVANNFWAARARGDVSGHMFVSAETTGHDLVGDIDGQPTVWKICDTTTELNGYDLATTVGSMMIARLPFMESVDIKPVGEGKGNKRLPDALSVRKQI